MENKEERIKFSELANFFPKQKLALEATKTYKYVLYGGTKGSGKSRWLRFVLLWWLIYYFQKYDIKGVRAGLFCEDFPALQDRHISKIKQEFPDWLGTWNESKHEFTLADEYGGGILSFRNLDDVSKYESVEFAIIGIDELQKDAFPVFKTLRTRLRWPGIPDVRFVAAAIPGGEAYVVQYWVDRIFPPDEAESDQFFFIQALPKDNPYLDPNYYKQLESLDPVEKDAYLRGNFHAFEQSMDEQGWMKLLSSTELANAEIDFGMHAGFRFLGVDPGAGGDESSLVDRSQTMAEVLFNKKLADTMALVPIIGKFEVERRYDLIAVDIVGVGRGLYDRLIELGYRNVIGVNFGASPKTGKRDKKEFMQKSYFNLKAELFDKARNWVLKGGKLDRNPNWNQLAYIKYKIDSDRVVKIQGKDDLLKAGFKSPNVADAFALTFYEDDEIIKSMRDYRDQQNLNDDMPRKSDGFGFVKNS